MTAPYDRDLQIELMGNAHQRNEARIARWKKDEKLNRFFDKQMIDIDSKKDPVEEFSRSIDANERLVKFG